MTMARIPEHIQPPTTRDEERTPDRYGRSPAEEATARTDIVNEALRQIGEVSPDMMRHIDLEAVYRENREAVMQNFSLEPGAVNRAADAMRYACAPNRERFMGRNARAFESLEVHIERRPDRNNDMQVVTSLGSGRNQRNFATTTDYRDMEHRHIHEVMHRVAREHARRHVEELEHARRHVEELERAILDQLMLGFSVMRTRPDGRVAGAISDIATVAGGISDVAMHWGRDSIGPVIEVKEEDAKSIDWLAPYPKTIEFGGITGHLLDDTFKVYDEGLKMQHCLKKKHYTMGIRKGRYLVYHIDVPKRICKSGMTLSFERDRNGPRETWKFHMCKGKANSSQKDAQLVTKGRAA